MKRYWKSLIPNYEYTNLREWENEFSHCCKLVLLSCRIVSHATCLLMASKHDVVKNLMHLCTYV